jgi:tetratricopeptide (TPR) repeat protein
MHENEITRQPNASIPAPQTEAANRAQYDGETVDAGQTVVPPSPESARRANLLKWSLGCTGLAMTVCASLTMVLLIVAPIAFRGLTPEWQYRLTRRLPFLEAFQPTQPFKNLPTMVATSAEAMALLSTPVKPASTAQATATAIPTDDLRGLPTSILATMTPLTAQPASPTLEPTMLIGPTATPEIPPTLPPSTPINVPALFFNSAFKLVPQDWNNCGPANLTQTLQYYGWQGEQKDAADYLKPNREDRNVSPQQMVNFVNSKTGVRALWRVAGDLQMIRKLVSQRFAVILEMGYDVPRQGWMGHYATITGYDNGDDTISWLDTNEENENKGPVREKTSILDSRWQQFNRLFIVVYPQDRNNELAAILGSDADIVYNAQHALNLAIYEASAQPSNPFTWFNVGSSYVLLGEYQKAATAFDQAQSVGNGLPFRILWYEFSPYEAYYNVGNYTNVIALTQTSSLYVEETYYWRGMAEAAQGRTAQAIEDFRRALRFNPNYTQAAERMAQVQNGNFTPPVVAQANGKGK